MEIRSFPSPHEPAPVRPTQRGLSINHATATPLHRSSVTASTNEQMHATAEYQVETRVHIDCSTVIEKISTRPLESQGPSANQATQSKYFAPAQLKLKWIRSLRLAFQCDLRRAWLPQTSVAATWKLSASLCLLPVADCEICCFDPVPICLVTTTARMRT